MKIIKRKDPLSRSCEIPLDRIQTLSLHPSGSGEGSPRVLCGHLLVADPQTLWHFIFQASQEADTPLSLSWYGGQPVSSPAHVPRSGTPTGQGCRDPPASPDFRAPHPFPRTTLLSPQEAGSRRGSGQWMAGEVAGMWAVPSPADFCLTRSGSLSS